MLKVSHVVCKVKNLKDSVEQFRKKGFDVIYGSEPEKATNALIWFKKGPFIEIMKFNDEYYKKMSKSIGDMYGNIAKEKVDYWCDTEDGFCDIAAEDENNNGVNNFKINNNNMEKLREKLAESNIKSSKLIKGKRVNTNNDEIKYSLFYLENKKYPFIVSSYEIDEKPKGINHRNGSLYISKVHIQVEECDYELYKEMFKNDEKVILDKGDSTEVKNIFIKGMDKKNINCSGMNIMGEK